MADVADVARHVTRYGFIRAPRSVPRSGQVSLIFQYI